MKFLKKPLLRKRKATLESDHHMRIAPVANPLDSRDDGSIREGDPAWEFMMEVMRSGKAGIATQNSDGTWTTKVD